MRPKSVLPLKSHADMRALMQVALGEEKACCRTAAFASLEAWSETSGSDSCCSRSTRNSSSAKCNGRRPVS